MFQRFLGRFPPEGAIGCSGEELLVYLDPLPVGFPDLVIRFAGATFGDGLYRLYEPGEIRRWTDAALEVFPDLRGRIVCFGMSWLGYQYALDVERTEDGQPLTLMLDPGAAEAVEIPATFVGFHEEVLLEYADAILGADLFDEWRAEGHAPSEAGQCAGFRVPIFQGGEESVANLELTAAEEYWARFGRERSGADPTPAPERARIA
jgi:hypothetical protein